jgi:hypothetical protein
VAPHASKVCLQGPVSPRYAPSPTERLSQKSGATSGLNLCSELVVRDASGVLVFPRGCVRFARPVDIAGPLESFVTVRLRRAWAALLEAAPSAASRRSQQVGEGDCRCVAWVSWLLLTAPLGSPTAARCLSYATLCVVLLLLCCILCGGGVACLVASAAVSLSTALQLTRHVVTVAAWCVCALQGSDGKEEKPHRREREPQGPPQRCVGVVVAPMSTLLRQVGLRTDAVAPSPVFALFPFHCNDGR